MKKESISDYMMFSLGITVGAVSMVYYNSSLWLFLLSLFVLSANAFLLTHRLVTKKAWKGLLRRSRR